jgi:hypothetical protein
MINEKNGLLVLLNNIINTLKAIEVDSVKLFKYVNIYNSQFQNLGIQNTYDKDAQVDNLNYPFKMPAAFVNAETISVSTMSQKRIEKEVRLSINFGIYALDFEKNWHKPYAMTELVHAALQQLKPLGDNYSALQLSGEMPNTNFDNVYVYQLFYDTVVVDETAYDAGTSGTFSSFEVSVDLE